LSQPPKLRRILGKPPNSTNFNKLQVFIIVTFGSLNQALHQACYDKYSLSYQAIVGFNTNQKICWLDLLNE